jgi:hypothetical protein
MTDLVHIESKYDIGFEKSINGTLQSELFSFSENASDEQILTDVISSEFYATKYSEYLPVDGFEDLDEAGIDITLADKEYHGPYYVRELSPSSFVHAGHEFIRGEHDHAEYRAEVRGKLDVVVHDLMLYLQSSERIAPFEGDRYQSISSMFSAYFDALLNRSGKSTSADGLDVYLLTEPLPYRSIFGDGIFFKCVIVGFAEVIVIDRNKNVVHVFTMTRRR